MLGPNGAGKTTCINMLIGFTPPSSGTATIEGLDVRADMNKIYTLMGVCPQVPVPLLCLSPIVHDFLTYCSWLFDFLMQCGMIRLKYLCSHTARCPVGYPDSARAPVVLRYANIHF
jgi:ABC-type Na+ transport system ATPase subunit NatA